ncbi:hypothetical protein GCM10009662_20610 [Catellatospora coxensis]|uniref:Uncharacterized protein n=1 Tax=Catellatospora coxensis TaxID=310354 RepID=A0A8J3PD66_9ACTN|nr:hypothetical protein Cco03nite_74360 [Catellatospora coxensis]
MEQRRPAARRAPAALGLTAGHSDGGADAPPYYTAEPDIADVAQEALLLAVDDEVLDDGVLLLDEELLPLVELLDDELLEAAGAVPEPLPRESVR